MSSGGCFSPLMAKETPDSKHRFRNAPASAVYHPVPSNHSD